MTPWTHKKGCLSFVPIQTQEPLPHTQPTTRGGIPHYSRGERDFCLPQLLELLVFSFHPHPCLCICLSSVCVSSCVSMSGIILGCLSTLFIEAESLSETQILCLQLLGLLPAVIPTRHFCGFLGTPAPVLKLAELPSHLFGLHTVAF